MMQLRGPIMSKTKENEIITAREAAARLRSVRGGV